MSAFAADDLDAADYSYAEDDPAATTTPPIATEQTSSDQDGSHGRGRSTNPLLGGDNSLVSELEQEVLDEYSRLLRNVNQVSQPEIPRTEVRNLWPDNSCGIDWHRIACCQRCGSSQCHFF